MSKRAFGVGALLALLMVLLPVLPVLAQGGLGTPQGELAFSRPIAAMLAAGESHTYTFRGHGNESVSISMEAANPMLDPVLELYGPGHVLLAFSDDMAIGEPGARIAGVVLAGDGEYTVVARSFGNTGSGAYALFATRAVVTGGAGGGEPGMAISLGETVTEAIDPVGQVDRWMFTGSTGQVVSIALNHTPGSYLDPLLELLGPSGNVLATSDDEGGDLNSLISGYALPADGVYTILARSWGNSSTGGYTLTLSEGVVSAVGGGQVTVGNTGNIEPGQTVEAVLTPGTFDDWTFVAEVGQVFSVALYAEADSFDTTLRLLDADNFEIEYNDDGGPGLNSMVRGWTVPADGAYTIRVGSYSGSSGGAYALAVEPGDQFLLLDAWRQGELILGEPAEGHFQGGVTTHAWTFDVDADQFLAVDYTADDLTSLYIEVIGPEGDYYGYLEPGLPLYFEQAGQYFLFVEGYGASDYTLTLSEAEPPPVNTGNIEAGQTIEAELAPAATDEWTLVAEAGQVFSIAVYAEGNNFDTTLSIVDPDGSEIAFDDDGATNLNSMLRGWRSPADGAFVIHVASYSGRGGGPYALTVVSGDSFVLPESWLQGPLPPAETVEGSFEESGQTHVWTFEAGAGQSLQLEYTGDLYIEVLDADGEYYTYFESGQPVTFDQSGLYYLVLQTYDAGDYTLEMTAVASESDSDSG